MSAEAGWRCGLLDWYSCDRLGWSGWELGPCALHCRYECQAALETEVDYGHTLEGIVTFMLGLVFHILGFDRKIGYCSLNIKYDFSKNNFSQVYIHPRAGNGVLMKRRI
jgi:hypothetical protein